MAGSPSAVESTSAPPAASEFERFVACLHEPFRLHWGAEPEERTEVVLVEATLAPDHCRPPAGIPNLRQEPFSLLFRAASIGVLESRMYRLVHEQMGDLALFLSPVAQDGDGTYYEAILN